MKKVGIVSCYFKNNYGSMLQAYATQKFLDNNQIVNETISIDNNLDFKKGKRKYYIKQLLNFSFIKSKFGMIKLKVDKKRVKGLARNIAIRNRKYQEFREEKFNLSVSCTTYFSLKNIVGEKYSDIVVGSDQLWLPVNVVADYYTLNWVPEEINKVSYSTSFGISEIPKKYTKMYKSFLQRINHISVREQEGVKIVEQFGMKAEKVCDPTLLLTKQEWEQEMPSDRIIPEKYILCYFLGANMEHRKFAERLKQKTNLKVVSLNHADEYVKYSDIYADIAPYDIGPKEFLNLIKYAEYVCTDSFHGTIFSLIFNKEFFDFRRHKLNNKMSTNSRIDSLLETMGVSKARILSGNEKIEEVLKNKLNYEEINNKLNDYREVSRKWFLNSLTYKNREEEKFIKIEGKDECSGCTACASVCPKNAITMMQDEEGFFYPKVDQEKCIHCGICKKTCPIINKKAPSSFKQKAFLFQNKNEGTRNSSTSGGFFSSIGEYVIKNNGVVYGAAYNKDFIVEHQKAETMEELQKFRGSKYVQSNQGECFREIQEQLQNNKLICYSGTPCQVAGLKAFLKRDYENLILVDMMCHSVPSPFVFEKYKQYILKTMQAKKILDINFRDKSKYGYKYSMMTIKTDNGVYSQGIDTDPYLRAFFGDCSVRPACYHCAFKTQQRVSDLTIWDCFNVREIDKEFDDDKGTTRLLVQSAKGEKILRELENIRLKEIDLDIAVKGVKEMKKSVLVNSNRSQFFNDINSDNVFNKYFPINMKTRLNGGIRKFLSITGLYTETKQIAKKILRK